MLTREEQLSIIDQHIHRHSVDLYELHLNIVKLQAIDEDASEYLERQVKVEKCVQVLLEEKARILDA